MYVYESHSLSFSKYIDIAISIIEDAMNLNIAYPCVKSLTCSFIWFVSFLHVGFVGWFSDWFVRTFVRSLVFFCCWPKCVLLSIHLHAHSPYFSQDPIIISLTISLSLSYKLKFTKHRSCVSIATFSMALYGWVRKIVTQFRSTKHLKCVL